jgi:hypothetical protein
VARLVLILHLTPEARHLVLAGDIATVCGNPNSLRGLGPTDLEGLGEVLLDDVASGDATALREELPGQLTADAGSPTGHDSNLSSEVLHFIPLVGSKTTEELVPGGCDQPPVVMLCRILGKTVTAVSG